VLPSPETPFAPLSSSQFNFLSLHVDHVVTAWRWHWCETMLRATAGGGARMRTATLWADELESLVASGLMEWGMGSQVRPTSAGVELVRSAKVRERA
jgi:hypothetical protein